MEASVIGFDRSAVDEKIALNEVVFGSDYRPDLMSLVVNWQLAKRRAGTHSTKGISQVSGTTRKPYRQKGTGRARQGSLRSPQFRGGAIIFGPVVRSHAFHVNKNVRKYALRSALSSKLAIGELFVLRDAKFPTSKTSDFVKWWNDSDIRGLGKSILIVSSQKDENLVKATSNIHSVKVIWNCAVNVYDILTHDLLLLEHQSVKDLENRLSFV